ncbi:MAG: permease-like cell division protein FtsX [Eubacterium sp.]|nr:permease-like cell division protein FtsX [Eubacterium sp.]
MNQNDMMQIKNTITMPAGLANDLIQSCTAPQTKRPAFVRVSRLAFALAAAVLIVVSGTTSFAYNIYQEKNLAVFMDADLSQTEIDRIGEELSQLPGVSSCRSVSGDEAWANFSSTYLNEELAASFTENPLKDSFHYRLSVQLNADTEKVREEISGLEEVRLVQDLGELKE